jgi:hypothetical protein
MIRATMLLLGCLAAMAAAPLEPLPVPPIPPDDPPGDIAAPVPNTELRSPSDLADEDAKIKLQLYRLHRYSPSQGFLPGSQYQSTEDRKAIQTPGFSLSVPLH